MTLKSKFVQFKRALICIPLTSRDYRHFELAPVKMSVWVF